MDYDIKSKYNEEKNIWEVKVCGEIDIFNSNNFKDEMNQLISEKQIDLHINCSELKYIDSTALGALVSLLKKVKNYNGVITLSGVSSNMNRLLKITKLDKAFLITGGRDDR